MSQTYRLFVRSFSPCKFHLETQPIDGTEPRNHLTIADVTLADVTLADDGADADNADARARAQFVASDQCDILKQQLEQELPPLAYGLKPAYHLFRENDVSSSGAATEYYHQTLQKIHLLDQLKTYGR